mmetsp:Transcript_49857/g.149924  ORF Transcript_49857/g.149924 Transcript_49857/m.149924 type:complete len:96 (+) Transcript_49857:65-352(+)
MVAKACFRVRCPLALGGARREQSLKADVDKRVELTVRLDPTSNSVGTSTIELEVYRICRKAANVRNGTERATAYNTLAVSMYDNFGNLASKYSFP